MDKALVWPAVGIDLSQCLGKDGRDLCVDSGSEDIVTLGAVDPVACEVKDKLDYPCRLSG